MLRKMFSNTTLASYDLAYLIFRKTIVHRVAAVKLVVWVLAAVVAVVDLYSASRSASNAINLPFRRKMMSFQRRFEAVGTMSRVPE